MRSPWNHSTCEPCWELANPGRFPVRIKPRLEEVCCFCGDKSTSGIYVREDPGKVCCKGEHGD